MALGGGWRGEREFNTTRQDSLMKKSFGKTVIIGCENTEHNGKQKLPYDGCARCMIENLRAECDDLEAKLNTLPKVPRGDVVDTLAELEESEIIEMKIFGHLLRSLTAAYISSHEHLSHLLTLDKPDGEALMMAKQHLVILFDGITNVMDLIAPPQDAEYEQEGLFDRLHHNELH
jgi:hypothetical protein